MKPTVSIVVCTYNGASFLKEQMDSLLLQDYPIHEIIVQDDGSTDDTWRILEGYARQYAHVHLYKNVGPHGINGNFFSAMKRATGDYIAISDQDDIWDSQKISRQMNAIGEQMMCGGFSKPFSSDGFPVKWDSRVPCLHLLRLAYLSEIPGHVQLFRRELLDHLPPVEMCPYLYDWQLQFMASAAEQLVFVPQVLVNFRRHAQAATATKPVTNKGGELWRTLWFLCKHYTQLHAFAAERFSRILSFTEHLKKQSPLYHTESVELVQQLADIYQHNGLAGYLRLTVFCLRHHQQIFHAPEKNLLKSWLRSLYFPLYSLNYYRGIIKSR